MKWNLQQTLVAALTFCLPVVVHADANLASITKQANAGDARAQAYLGARAAREHDLVGAYKWDRRAAESGDHGAQNALAALCLMDIPGVHKSDIVESYAWLLIGADASKDANALKMKKAIRHDLTPDQLKQAKARANMLRKKIAAKQANKGKPKLFKYVAEFDGPCTKAIFLNHNDRKSCRGRVLNIVRTDGRSEFGYYMANTTTVIFSGNKDSQPTKNRYILKVDSVRMLSGSKSQGTLPASGRCIVSGQIVKAAIVHCKATVDKKLLEFQVDASQPVKLLKHH